MSHALCKPLLPTIKTSRHVCVLSQEEPCSATDATEQSISWVTMQSLKECHQLPLYIGERCGHAGN
jgi:hypothetical protein